MKLIDLHCDTIHGLMNERISGNLKSNNGHVDIQKMQISESFIQMFAMFVDLEKTNTPYKTCKEMITFYNGEIMKNPEINDITSIEMIKENGLNAMLSIEEGGVLEGDLRRLREFYLDGVRSLILVWNYENQIGYPNIDYKYSQNGLKPFGFEVIDEMSELGMLIDVSHLSDKGFWDVCNRVEKPFIASHSCSRTIQDNPRNLTDEMIRALANKGGVIGINFFGMFVNGTMHSTIEGLIRHLKHIYNVGGEDVLAIGTDYDGLLGTTEIDDISKMVQLRNAMRKNGFTESQSEKVFSGNAYRVICDVLK